MGTVSTVSAGQLDSLGGGLGGSTHQIRPITDSGGANLIHLSVPGSV